MASAGPQPAGGGGGDHKGGGGGGAGGERKRKESIVDLTRYLEKMIRVKFAGGREASGVLKGFDPLLNLVLDDTVEHLRGGFLKSILGCHVFLVCN